MKARTRLILALGSSLFLITVAGVNLALPSFVKGQVEKRYPYVKVGRAEFRFPYKKVLLHDVHVEKANVQGDFPLVTITRADESVEITGGTFDYTMADHKDPTAGEQHHKITALDLKGTIHRDGYSAEVEKLSVDAKQVCFHYARVREPGGTVWAEAGDGCAHRDMSEVALATVTVHEEALAHFVSGLPSGVVEARDVVVFPSKPMAVRAKSVSYAQTTASNVLVQYVEPTLEVDVNSVTTEHPRAYSGPMTFRGFHTGFNPKTLRDQPVSVSLGDAHVVLNYKTEAVSGNEDCNTWLDTLPKEMHVPAMDGLRFTGQLGFEVRLKPEVKLNLHNHCKAICPVPSIEAMKHAFTYTVYDKDNQETTREMGPGTPDWVKLSDISPLMPIAVENLEDPSFLHHHGFVPGALRNSLQEDLDKDKFLRGGSTITMQLAKNVFLKRSKTIGRKVQEALLTIALESCLTKDQIMELYLNAVEFGPDLYGIGPAAKQYFDEDPDMLDAKQAFYLASILPKPKKAPKPDEKTMARVANLMQTLVNRGSIDEDMLTQVDWEKL